MPRTLVLVFHPDLHASRANRALARHAARLDDTEVVDMHRACPSGRVDADREVQRLLAADRVVMQFPVRWYATPALMRNWQDAVLTRMYYLRHAEEGRHFEGTPLLVAATAGNTPEAYSPQGVNRFPLADLLRPLQAMAHRCALPWADPFLLYRADRLDDAALEAAAEDYATRLRQWIGHTDHVAVAATR